MKTILVATDGSPASLKAAERGADLAAHYPGSQLILVNVAPLSLLDLATVRIPLGGEDLLPHQLEERLKKNSEEILTATLKHMSAAEGVQTRNLLGHPGDAICDMAAELGADLLVVGARGHGQFHRILLGSVCDYVVHHAPCGVMVVKS